MRRLGLAVLVALAACSRSKQEAPSAGREWRSEGYALPLPEGWQYEEDAESSIPGLRLVRPEGLRNDGEPSEPSTLISLSRYKGGTYYKDPEELARAEAPRAKLQKATLNGRPALTFETTFSEPFPPLGAAPTMHRSRSRWVLLQDDEGFWAFQYTAVESRFAANLPAFQKLLDRFKKS